ncbi:MAG TPA: SDR family oxidoreductase [Salinivirgaceae bacterium]|nr:SDR family oxidoreductase [Salinivirgaceae bacterium]
MKSIALITGATSGIGKATALELAKLNYRLIITGRRADRLRELASMIENQYNTEVYPLEFDIRSRDATEKAWESLPDDLKQVDVLINNAGLAAGLDHIHTGNPDDWDQMIDTNVRGILNISRLVIPQMVERHKGHIINISSIAGKETYEKGAVYCASKHAVEALTKGMRIDLLPYGIKVSSVSPGMVETEFSKVRFKGDAEKAAAVYKGLQPLVAEDIAQTIVFILTRPSHVCINDIVVMPTAQASAFYTYRENK